MLANAGRAGLYLMIAVVLSFTVLSYTVPAHAGWVWTAETGWYNPAKSIPTTPADLLVQAETAFAAKAYGDAAVGYRRLLILFPKAPETSQAALQLLESQYRGEDLSGALETIEAILAQNPDSQTIVRVVKRKYDIGYAYLNGAKRSFLWFSMSGKRAGIRTLQSIADRYPFQPFSDDALFHLAGSYFDDERYEEAELVYERLVGVYRQSEWAGIAEYQIGETTLRRQKGAEYDFSLVDKAQRSFELYRTRYPGGDKREEADRQLRRISEMRAEKMLGIAKFYLREDRHKAANYYLQRILTSHPESAAATAANELLKGAVGTTESGAPDEEVTDEK